MCSYCVYGMFLFLNGYIDDTYETEKNYCNICIMSSTKIQQISSNCLLQKELLYQ